MVNIIFNILHWFLIATLLVIVTGFVVYALNPKVESWEKGIIKLFTLVADAYYFVSDKKRPEQVINNDFILSREEVFELVKRFDRNPYLNPVLGTYTVRDSNDISWLDIRAFGLYKAYKDLSKEDLRRMCRHIIEGYFIETRNACPEIYVKIASANRLYAAIPLTIEASELLRRQEERHKLHSKNITHDDVLEETICNSGEKNEDRI